ncbi:unnamed protein product [Vicia faba]|uniref:FRIGIDA-like protein n=1 Tax=Vicia faba TaxID=3906 RepID=A0AAV0YTX1_VICFA|nr:unnamed protein product [Vicia faba]
MVSMVATSQDNVLDSGDLVREQDEHKEKCETLERENSTTEKELVELCIKAKLVDSLQEKVDRYGSLPTLAAHVEKLKVSLIEGDDRWKKASEATGRDQTLLHARGFYLGIFFIADQLDPFQVVPRDNVRGDPSVSDSARDV